MDTSSVVVLSVIVFLVLGYGAHAADQKQSGWPSLLIAAWALPVAFTVHFFRACARVITWSQFWEDIKLIPEILEEYLDG